MCKLGLCKCVCKCECVNAGVFKCVCKCDCARPLKRSRAYPSTRAELLVRLGICRLHTHSGLRNPSSAVLRSRGGAPAQTARSSPLGWHPLPTCYPQACPKRWTCARRARSCRLVLVAGRCAASRSHQFSGLFPQVCAAARICNCHHPSRCLPARIRLPQDRAPIILFICTSDAGRLGRVCQTLYPRPRLLRSHPGLPGSCRSMGLARRPERTAWLPLHAYC